MAPMMRSREQEGATILGPAYRYVAASLLYQVDSAGGGYLWHSLAVANVITTSRGFMPEGIRQGRAQLNRAR
eukprot:2824844-Lingulodinium_polyedra.AAC.1